MKKFIVIFGSLLLVTLMIFSFASCSKVELAEGEIVAVFRYGDMDITQVLSDEDSETVRTIFEGKSMFSDSPSCGFSENVSLAIGGDTYCIACDDCGIIYHVKEDKYFRLSEQENEALRELLVEYGLLAFPCEGTDSRIGRDTLAVDE